MTTIKLLILFFLCNFMLSSLTAEVESVLFTWPADIAFTSTDEILETNLLRVPGVAEVKVQSGLSQAQIRWKPNVKFSYQDLNQAVRAVGLKIDVIMLKVRGTIGHTTRQVTLTSLGDGTKFEVLGPLNVPESSSAAAVRGNVESYRLSDTQHQRLIDAEKEDKVVTIQGPLFLPYRSLDLKIISENIQIPKGL